MSTSARCHACASDAVAVYRVVPRSATLTLFDAQPRDVNACSGHVEAAKQIGQVLAVTPLGETAVTRTVQP